MLCLHTRYTRSIFGLFVYSFWPKMIGNSWAFVFPNRCNFYTLSTYTGNWRKIKYRSEFWCVCLIGVTKRSVCLSRSLLLILGVAFFFIFSFFFCFLGVVQTILFSFWGNSQKFLSFTLFDTLLLLLRFYRIFDFSLARELLLLTVATGLYLLLPLSS